MKSKKFIKEAGEMTTADKIYERTKIKAAKIRSKAELIRAQNQLKAAKLNQAKINNKIRSLENDSQKAEDVKVKTVANQEQQPVQQQAPAPQQQPVAKESKYIHSLFYRLLTEADEAPAVEVAGTTPQTKEEAETARIQAATREIQQRIGEYSGGQFAQQQDPNAMGGDPGAMGGDPSMQDPNAMGGDPSMQDPSMMGQPGAEQPPDPLKGFGDISAPMDPMGVSNIDPATGMPSNEPKITLTALGRLYHLKRIYTKLLRISKILDKYPYKEIVPVRKDVRDMLELMSLISTNLKSYKENIDEIIINMYCFLKEVIRNISDIIVMIKQRSAD